MVLFGGELADFMRIDVGKVEMYGMLVWPEIDLDLWDLKQGFDLVLREIAGSLIKFDLRQCHALFIDLHLYKYII